jgi:hypothetical protein
MSNSRDILTKKQKKIYDHNRYLTNREYFLAYGKRHYRENTKRITERNTKYKHEWRKKVINFLGGKCKKCGYNLDIRALQIDHINGGGIKDRKINGTQISFWRKVLEDNSRKYQLLCANCNCIKRIENHEQ